MRARRLVIPKKLTIGGKRFVVRTSRQLRKQGLDGWCAFGRTSGVILIADDLSPAKREETFIHEVLHALFPDRPRSAVLLHGRTEERVVEALDAPLVRVLRRLRWR